MSRSRHLRRILAAGVVASLSITWGAGIAFANTDPSISQDNGVSASQNGCGRPEAAPVSQGPEEPGCGGNATGNTGANAQFAGAQAKGAGQADVGIANGDSSDAFAAGLFLAVALGGDALAGASNASTVDNDLNATNGMTTGDATGGNSLSVLGNEDGNQTNTNIGGDAITVGIGDGADVIHQGNAAYVSADGNTALANSGANVQATGGQFIGVGQLALAGAQGSPALALSLGLGIAVGGDATAYASNSSGHTGDFGNYQTVENTMTTGDALAANSVQVGTPAKGDDAAVPFSQANDNSGNAYTGEASLGFVGFAGSFIGQHNDLVVGPSGNVAVANSGANLQASGPQLSGTLQLAGAGAGSGWAASLGIIALAFSGDAAAGAVNQSDNANDQTVSNDLQTGDAIAQNYTSVIATQSNANSGNAGSLQALAIVGFGIGGIIQTNSAEIVANCNTAAANTGLSGQIAGFQGNGTIQGAGALAGSGWAGTLGGLALAVAGDSSAGAVNGALSNNQSDVSNLMTTGDAAASNIQSVSLSQTNDNSGWAAGAAVLDGLAIGAGFVYQDNYAYSDSSYNTALANSGANVQGTLGQGNLTLQGAGAGSWGGGAISLGILAGAVGGDASAWAINTADSTNSQKVHNDLTTGAADARNVTVIDLTQGNTNGGEDHFDGAAVGIAAIAIAGVGVGVISQSNYAEIYSDGNFAGSNTGANAQFSGPQINITGQLALAGAQGGGALGLALLGAGAVGGDADVAASNTSTSSNWQLVCNDLITGVATAVNGLSVTAKQTNANSGDAAGAVLGAAPLVYASSISQSNSLSVEQNGSNAVANTGLNSQSSGAQVDVSLQGSAAQGDAGQAGAAALLGSVAVDGDPTVAVGNSSISVNSTEVHNSMETGDATAVNQVNVDVQQNNHNEGDSISVGL